MAEVFEPDSIWWTGEGQRLGVGQRVRLLVAGDFLKSGMSGRMGMQECFLGMEMLGVKLLCGWVGSVVSLFVSPRE